jgi:hypothetical protein
MATETKTLPWHKAKKLRGATTAIKLSLKGKRDRVACTICSETLELVDTTEDGLDRNEQVNAFSRQHYERHPIMIAVE